MPNRAELRRALPRPSRAEPEPEPEPHPATVYLHHFSTILPQTNHPVQETVL